MEPNDYQDDALRTWHPVGTSADMLYLAGKLTVEAGEAAQLVIKAKYHGKPLALDELRDELGDVLWYVAVLAHEYDLTMNDIMSANIAKLRARHPFGDPKAYYFDPANYPLRPTTDGATP